MTLEEVEKQFTLEQRTATNTVDENEIGVKKRLPGTAEKPYAVYYAIDPKNAVGFNGGMLEYDSLEEVKNSFVGLSSASGMDANGWTLSPEKG